MATFPITGKTVVDAEAALIAEQAFSDERNKVIVTASPGRIGFISGDASNRQTKGFMVQTAYLCTSASEVTAAQGNTANVVYDIPNQQVLTYNGSAWVNNPARGLVKDFGSGRIFINTLSGKIFYLESEWEVYWLNGYFAP